MITPNVLAVLRPFARIGAHLERSGMKFRPDECLYTMRYVPGEDGVSLTVPDALAALKTWREYRSEEP